MYEDTCPVLEGALFISKSVLASSPPMLPLLWAPGAQNPAAIILCDSGAYTATAVAFSGDEQHTHKHSSGCNLYPRPTQTKLVFSLGASVWLLIPEFLWWLCVRMFFFVCVCAGKSFLVTQLATSLADCQFLTLNDAK